MPASVSARCSSVVLLSPSTSTDFEIHLSELMGWNKKRKMDVVAAVNELADIRINAVFGDDETEFPLADIHNRNFRYRRLPGGHHYEGNMNMVAAAVIAGF
jgi:type IV secretory pathway VirJ component